MDTAHCSALVQKQNTQILTRNGRGFKFFAGVQARSFCAPLLSKSWQPVNSSRAGELVAGSSTVLISPPSAISTSHAYKGVRHNSRTKLRMKLLHIQKRDNVEFYLCCKFQLSPFSVRRKTDVKDGKIAPQVLMPRGNISYLAHISCSDNTQ